MLLTVLLTAWLAAAARALTCSDGVTTGCESAENGAALSAVNRVRYVTLPPMTLILDESTGHAACFAECKRTAGCFSLVISDWIQDPFSSETYAYCYIESNPAALERALVVPLSNYTTFDFVSCNGTGDGAHHGSIIVEQTSVRLCTEYRVCRAWPDLVNVPAILTDGSPLDSTFAGAACRWEIAPVDSSESAVLTVLQMGIPVGARIVVHDGIDKVNGQYSGEILQVFTSLSAVPQSSLPQQIRGRSLAVVYYSDPAQRLDSFQLAVAFEAVGCGPRARLDASTLCVNCPAGTSTAAPSNGPCLACPRASFSFAGGRCVDCPLGLTTAFGVQTTWDSCGYTRSTYLGNTSLTYSQAEQACRNLGIGGSLVTIRSEDENNALAAVTNSSYRWIGLRDFAWASGEPVTYSRLVVAPALTNYTAMAPGGYWLAMRTPNFTLGYACEYYRCASGFYFDGTRCRRVVACAAGQYRVSPATNVSQTVCAAISSCNATSYESAAPTDTSDRVCTPRVCAAGQYVRTPPGSPNTRVCANITRCRFNETEVRAPTISLDRLCAALDGVFDGLLSRAMLASPLNSSDGSEFCFTSFTGTRDCTGVATGLTCAVTPVCLAFAQARCPACAARFSCRIGLPVIELFDTSVCVNDGATRTLVLDTAGMCGANLLFSCSPPCI